MRVSWRHTVATAVALSAIGFGTALAGDGSGGVTVPGASVGIPTHPVGGTGSGCCGHKNSHMVGVPQVNPGFPSIGAPGVPGIPGGPGVGGGDFSVDVQTNQSLVVVGPQGVAGGTIIAGGGAFIPGTPGVAPSSLDQLDVAGVTEQFTETVIEQVPTQVQREVCFDQQVSGGMATVIRPVRAVCIDDTGTPHPASQVDAGQRVPGTFSGELYRCMAGTSMQVTIGTLLDGSKASFDQGETFTCSKGEALVHLGGGKLACAPQSPRRDCNERSLLRMHGPGLKLISSARSTQATQRVCKPQVETIMQTQERQVVKEREVIQGPIVFDGGVGQGVF